MDHRRRGGEDRGAKGLTFPAEVASLVVKVRSRLAEPGPKLAGNQ